MDDDVIVRSRYPRYNVPPRRKKKSIKDTNTLAETIIRQVVICVIILVIIGLIKTINTPVTSYLTEKIGDLLSQDIELKSVSEEFNNIINKLTNSKTKDNAASGVEETSGTLSSDEYPTVDEQQAQDTTVKNEAKSPDNSDTGAGQQSQDDKGAVKQESKDGSGTKTGDKKQVTAQDMPVINSIKDKYAFAIPVSGFLSSAYGNRTDPSKKTEKFHNGVDIGANKGTTIKAALGGEVIQAGTDPTYGNYIKIQHGDGITTVYAHCSQLLVKKGQKVKQGDVIAKVGDTGAAVGAHLHFEIWKDGKPLDPLNFIKIPSA